MAIVGYRVGPLRIIFDFAIVLPSSAVAVRRLHDTDRTGWWFVAIVAAVTLFLVVSIVTGMFYLRAIAIFAGVGVLLCLFGLPGTPGPNRYGPDPFGPDGHIIPRPTA